MKIKNIEDVVSFARSDISASNDIVNHKDVLSDEYKSKTWLYFSDKEAGFSSGVWEAESFRVAFTSEHNEFCHVIEGIVRLTDKEGNSDNYKAGDSFVIPRGFSGVWENIGIVKKLFVIS